MKCVECEIKTKTMSGTENLDRRQFVDLEFDRNVEEIMQDNRVTMVARLLTRCEAIRARNI